MNYAERVKQIRGMAERNPYYDYNGGAGAHNYVGNGKQYFGYNGANEELPAYSTIITLQVSNANTAATAGVTLFNAIEDPTDATLPAGVTITISQGSTHVRVKSEIRANPWWIDGMKVRVQNSALQFDNALTLQRLEGTGEDNRATWDLGAGLSSIQFQALRVEHPNFRYKLDGFQGIQFTIRGSEVVTFIFNIRKKYKTANVAAGQAPTQVSGTMLPTGDPRFDSQYGKM